MDRPGELDPKNQGNELDTDSGCCTDQGTPTEAQIDGEEKMDVEKNMHATDPEKQMPLVEIRPTLIAQTTAQGNS